MAPGDPRIAIIGLGASAGGIEALEQFFRAMPAKPGLGFVIVTHLSPDHESHLHDVVARYTPMSVETARDGVSVEANRVYVLPSNAIMTIEGGVLALRRPEADRRERRLIDIFFGALAKDQGEYAAGVILSGGDGDGTLGIKAIKERGGLTLAQVADGTKPRHADMPDSAIATGLVDFAIPVQDMAAKLVDFARSLALLDGMATAEDEQKRSSLDDARRGIYALLRNQIGHDFSGYKTNTFHRRVQRRMQVVQIEAINAYVERLRQDPAEVVALFRDLLINVTSFFRDAAAFEALRTAVIPRLFEGRGADDTVRVWVPGCATGEEVYSIAILMREHMNTLRAVPRVQIFATDIDDRSLAAARTARYPEALVEGVSAERRRRFFTNDGGSYVVSKEVRDLCIFSPHSVLRDPPFSRMDMVSCRNLLIYFGPEAQDQVIPIFHYSLRPQGYLFLGTSENVSQFSDLFLALDKPNRIFRARADAQARSQMPLILSSLRPLAFPEGTRAGKGAIDLPLRHTVETHLIERFAPPHVVVNANGDVVYYSARTGKYLEPAAGAPSRQLLAMARKGLRLELRAALREAMETRRTAVRQNVVIEAEDNRVQMLTLTVDPMPDRPTDEPLFLVLFDDAGPPLTREDAVNRTHGDHDAVVAQLERELRDTRERLQAMIEEYETALEELKSSNEELVSVNEELQSANEELEASKEELQSLNEELQTVNIELGHKIDALDQSNNDLNNLFASTHIATVFLDRGLLIRNFTPPMAELFDILPRDRGRTLTSFAHKLDYPGLVDDLRTTLDTSIPLERQVGRSDGGAHFLARMRPYASLGGDTEGVVLTLVDVTMLTRAEAHQRVLIAELNHRVKNMLAIVVALSRQTAKGATSPKDFTDGLIRRLESMARAFELLSRENWKEAVIGDLIQQEMAAYGAPRTLASGPVVRLRPEDALALGMVFHELATNAVKFGALSTAAGAVGIRWTVTGGAAETARVRLHWEETGGPVPGPTAGLGFGLRLVERQVGYGLAGHVDFDWTPAGLAVSLDFPVRT